MKKIIVPSLVLVSSFSLFVSPALAVGPRPTLRVEREALHTTIKQEREDLKEKAKEQRLEVKTTIAQQRQDFRHKSLETVYNSIKSNLQKRFANINDVIKPKVEAKIADKEKSGKDMAAAKAKLAEYSTAKYTADLAAFTTKYNELIALNPIPAGSVPELAKLANTVRADLNSMRKVLLDAFRLAVKAK